MREDCLYPGVTRAALERGWAGSELVNNDILCQRKCLRTQVMEVGGGQASSQSTWQGRGADWSRESYQGIVA